MIEEAVNQDVNGNPAILRLKKSRKGGEASELFWTTDTKTFRIVTNRMLNKKASEYILGFARSISAN